MKTAINTVDLNRYRPCRITGFRLVLQLCLFFTAGRLFAESFTEPRQLLRIVTYNMHGGKGHNEDTDGTPTENLTAFKEQLQGEQILCFQEVDDWDLVQEVFSDFPYTYYTENQTTLKWWDVNTTAIAMVSKLPIVASGYKLIQIDPTYDLWKRHAQHVQIQIAEDRLLHVFHFHNTYNFNTNDFEYEQSGMVSFRDYVAEELGLEAITDVTNLVNATANVVMLGDYNLLDNLTDDAYTDNLPSIILPTYEHVSNSRDHINTPIPLRGSGSYTTYAQNISDHNAVWATLDLAIEPNGYSFWGKANFDEDEWGTAATAKTGDYDADGRTNFEEYTLGSDPKQADSIAVLETATTNATPAVKLEQR